MLKNRVIPSLLLKNEGLVKTTKFSKPTYVGDPINAIKIFNDKEVDELMVLDIVASKQGRDPDYHMIEMFVCRENICILDNRIQVIRMTMMLIKRNKSNSHLH
jgi:cyclase